MENTVKSDRDKKYNRFEERLKNRFEVAGSSLLGEQSNFSNLFAEDNTISPNYTVLKIKFERATLREASSFKKFMEKSFSEYGRNIIVDLNECEFVDSSFFGVLVSGVKRLKAMDKKFLLVYNSHNKLPIFSATGLDRVFTIFPSIKEATNS